MYDKKISFAQLTSDFRWENELAVFSTDISKGFNFTHEACDRYVGRKKVAINWEGAGGQARTITFDDLSQLTDRVASVLLENGVRPGDRVSVLMQKIPELYASLLAIWKIGAIFVPLFTAFGPEAIRYRLEDSQTKVLITHERFRGNVEPGISGLQRIFVVRPEGASLREGDQDLHEAMKTATAKVKPATVLPDDTAILLYTSGSTGMPKGAILSYKFFIFHVPYLRYACWLKPEDHFWCPADPAWAFGLLHAFVPMILGSAISAYDAPFYPRYFSKFIKKHGITNLAFTPTGFRVLIATQNKLNDVRPLRLRIISSAGETVTPNVIAWAQETCGVHVRDHYGFTEGGMLICNYNCCDMVIKPGSMGYPVPWHRVSLVDENGKEVDGKEPARIAIHKNQYGFYFKGYWNDETRTKEAFIGDWFIPADLARKDEDGYYWFEGRVDDVIICAGYRIGPFEIENALIEHPAVMESAVIGAPDTKKGETIIAYVVVKKEYAAQQDLNRKIMQFIRKKLSKHQLPGKIEFINALPKTPSGKIQKFKLREKHHRNA